MSPRTLIAALAIAATSLTTAAHADDAQEGLRVGADYAGSIQQFVVRLGDTPAGERSHVGYAMAGNCTFAGVLTPFDQLQIVFGGHAEATGPQVPQLTYIKCSVVNQVGEADFAEYANGGPASVTHEVPHTFWRVSPIIICIEGFAVFGPTPVTIITMAQVCTTLIA